MDWVELFEEAGLTDREARSLVLLSSSKELKASDLAKKLGTNRLDAYNFYQANSNWFGQCNCRPSDEVLIFIITSAVQEAIKDQNHVLTGLLRRLTVLCPVLQKML